MREAFFRDWRFTTLAGHATERATQHADTGGREPDGSVRVYTIRRLVRAYRKKIYDSTILRFGSNSWLRKKQPFS